jgi:putative chitinase
MATSNQKPGHPAGQISHRAGDATDETKQQVIDAILKKADEWKLSIQDKANLIAFAKIESGFNPNAVSHTHASGVMQITHESAKDAHKRLSGSTKIGGHALGDYQPFDINSNIEYGITIYLDKKRRANSNAADDIYKKYNSKPSEYSRHLQSLKSDSAKFQEELSRTGGLKLETVVPPKTQHPAPQQQPPRQLHHRHQPAKPAKYHPAAHHAQGISPPVWSQSDPLGIKPPLVCYDTHMLERLF